MPPLASPEQSFVPTAADCSELFDEFNVDEVPAGDDDAIDAYALLNVSEDTPTSAVRSRFHRLSLLMHPDRAGGKLSFPVVSDAHAMLKDAKSRNAYDALGASGVRSLHDDDVHAGMLTSRAVQDLVVSRAIENELSRLQSVAALRHRAEMTLDVAVGVRRFLLATYCSVQVGQSHVVVGAQLADGIAPAAQRRVVSHSHLYTKVSRRVSSRIVASFTATTSPSAELDAWRRFGEHLKAGIGGTLSRVGVGLWLSAQRNFSRWSVGALRWTLGPVPGVGVSFDHGGAVVPGVRSRGTKYAASGKLGIQNGTEFSVRKRIARSFTAYAETRLGLSEVVVECGAERAVGACVFSYALALDYVRGPCLLLCVRRGSCRLQLPLSVRRWPVLAALVAAPLSLLLLLAHRGRDDSHLNADGKEYVRNRLMAEKQRQNLAPLSRRIRQREQDCNGLVIVDAVYGVLQEPDDNIGDEGDDEGEEEHLQSGFESIRTIDAIDPLQCCVQSSSRLFLPATSKACLSGLFPHTSSSDSQLFVRYRYRNMLHEHTVFDDEPLSLPDPAHVVAH